MKDIYSQKKDKIIDDLRLIQKNNNRISNQPFKFRTKNRVKINDDSRGTYNTNCQIKFKTTMLKSCLSADSDTYKLVKGTIKIAGRGNDAAASQTDERNKEVIFKNCTPFTDFISEINYIQIDNAKGLDTIMPMYNLIE